MAAGVNLKYNDGIQTANYDSEQGVMAAKAICDLAKYTNNGFIGKEDSWASIEAYRSEFISAWIIDKSCEHEIKRLLGERNVGVTKLPKMLINGEYQQLPSFGGYNSIGVNANSKYPVTSQALAYYLTNPDSQRKRFQQIRLLPTSLSVLKDREVSEDPLLLAYEEQKPFTRYLRTIVGKPYWNSGIGQFGGDIVARKGEVSDKELKDSLSKIQKKINEYSVSVKL